MKREAFIIVGDALGAYGFPPPHPFSRRRLPAFWERAKAKGLHEKVLVLEPKVATREEIERHHERCYVDLVVERSQTGEGYLDQGDTPAFRGCFEAAACVVGSTLEGVRRIVAGEQKRGFIPIAGLHHARWNTAAGFCIFNDVSVAIRALREVHGIRRVAYVDIDAHHGDGVFYDFEGDPELCFADIHQDGRTLYPGTGFEWETGKGEAEGTKLNLPVPPGADDEVFFDAWAQVEAFVENARPELILLQCGADSVAGDPITLLRFSPEAHALAARRLRDVAERLGHGRVLALGGGGYDLENLAAAWTAVLEALI